MATEEKKKMTGADLNYTASMSGGLVYREHAFYPQFTYTEGVRYLAEECNCFWLLDVIASHQPKVINKLCAIGSRNFQVWLIEKQGRRGVRVTCWHDEPNKSMKLAAQRIPFSDLAEHFDLDQGPIKLYVETSGRDMRLMIPAER